MSGPKIEDKSWQLDEGNQGCKYDKIDDNGGF